MDLHTRLAVRWRQELNCLGFPRVSAKPADAGHTQARSPLLFGEARKKALLYQRSLRSNRKGLKLLICCFAAVVGVPVWKSLSHLAIVI